MSEITVELNQLRQKIMDSCREYCADTENAEELGIQCELACRREAVRMVCIDLKE